MTRLKSSAFVAMVFALFTVSHADANQLANPGFEEGAVLDQLPIPGASGWTTFGNSNTTSANLEPAHTGVGALQLVGGGGFGVPGAFQLFPAAPGQLWDAQGWMLTKTALPAGATFGLLKIVFGDGAGDLVPASINIGQNGPAANPGIESLPFLNNAIAPNTWTFTHAQGVAPAGTTQVRIFALFVDEAAGTGSFDDIQALLAGDFDNDHDIDSADLPLWKEAYGKTAVGDADGDGDSDGGDFLLWQRALAPAPVGGAVPEPSTVLLFAGGLALVGGRRLKNFNC